MGSHFLYLGLLFLTTIIIIARGELSIKYCIATHDSNCSSYPTINNRNYAHRGDHVACYDTSLTYYIVVICESDEPARVLLNNPIEYGNESRESRVETHGSAEEAKHRYFYELRLQPKDSVVHCESYRNASINDHLSLVDKKPGELCNISNVVADRSNHVSVTGLQLKLNSFHNHSYTLSCSFTNPQNGTVLDLQMDEHNCDSVFQCESCVELNLNGTLGLFHKDYIKTGTTGSRAVLENPGNGVVYCRGSNGSTGERVGKIDYIFNGTDSKKYLASQAPKHAVIAISEKTNREDRTFLCTASSFILFPTTLQFLLAFEDGRKEILSPAENSTLWTIGEASNQSYIVDQEIHFSQLPDDVTSITCFAIARNSSAEFFADKFNIPTGCSTAGVIWQVAGFVIASLFALALTVLTVVYLRFRWMHRDLFKREEDEFLAEFPENLRISPELLEKDEGKNIGEGQYGSIITGKYQGKMVAVKVPKVEEDTPTFKQVVLKELSILAEIGTNSHIVLFHGAVVTEIRNRKCDAVFEYSCHGDLGKFLRTTLTEIVLVRPVEGYEDPLSLEDHDDLRSNWLHYLISFCLQIASGMEYLTSKNVVHCDLAARNILIFERYTTAKITDFGLAGRIDEDLGIYKRTDKTRIPWTHMPPESLSHGTFSEASDVWAFGVTVWEIFSLGRTPYKNYGDNFKTFFRDLVHKDKRLSKPDRMPYEVYDLLMQCWINVDKVENRRPTFREVVQFFEKLLEDEGQGRLANTDGNGGMNNEAVGSSTALASDWSAAHSVSYHRNSQCEDDIELRKLKEDKRPLVFCEYEY